MSKKVIRYYDSNTARFLKFGHGAGSQAIHRAVWAEGVTDRQQAMNYVNSLVAAAVHSSGAERVLDIGCGVGGSMLYLAEHSSARVNGVTISPRQARVGRQLISSAGIDERCSLLAADFTDPQLHEHLTPPYDIAYAIESFLHMPDAEGFFAQAAEFVRPGGTLLLCDDFRAADPEPGENPQARPYKLSRMGPTRGRSRERLLRRFTRGWQVQTLVSPSQVRRAAEKYGFTLKASADLTPNLELNRPRDICIRVLVAVLGWIPLHTPFWHNLLGGDSLQRLLLRGDLLYLLLQFEKK